MKKYLVMVILLLFVSVFTVGCDMSNADTNRDIRHSGFSLSSTEFECPQLLPENAGYEKVKFMTGSVAITEDGGIFSLSLSQKYSNNLHCKKAEVTHKAEAVFDNSVYRADNGRIYYLNQTSDSAAFSEVTVADSNYPVYNIILSDRSVLKVVTANKENGHYYALKTDGNIYNMVVVKNGEQYVLVSSSIVFSKNDYNGEIVDFNYVGQTLGTFIKTKDSFYRMKATNATECSKYVDVVCEYKMMLDEGLTKHYDKVLGYSGSLLITTYGKEFAG